MADIYMDVDTALSEVPVNIMPLIDDTDFKTIEDAVAYNAAGMALFWHFVTSAGAYTVTAVTPTTAGTYDWTDQGTAGIYTIEIPASGGASINNDTEGYGWFTGKATGVLPWRGPVICFRAAALNDSLCDTNTTGVLAPTTSGRTLDVSAGGEAGVDWANVGSPTTTVTLSGTTVKTATDVETDTADIQSRLPAALVSGRIDASVGAMAANVLTATAIAADAITDAKVASDVTIASVTGSVGSVTGAVGSVTGAVGSVTGNVGGNVVGSVGSVTGLTASNLDTTISSRMATYTQPTGFLAATFPTGTIANTTNITAGTITTATNLTTNNDKTGYSIASGGIGSGAHSAAELNNIADANLDRNMATGTDSGSPTVRTPRQALRGLRNRAAISAGTATIYKEDDTTASWTASVTTTAGNPISEIDPAS